MDIRTSYKRSPIASLILASIMTIASLNLTGCGYNKLQEQDVSIESAWSEVINQYQRRADLTPQLVAVAKKYAQHEEDIFNAVAQARTQIGNVKLTPETLNDPKAMQQFQQAQEQMGSALSRLLAISESYPDLKSDEVFLKLQDDIAGSENRIAVARKRYIDKVNNYNATVRKFPTNITAKAFGMDTKTNFSVENEASISQAPKIDFGD